MKAVKSDALHAPEYSSPRNNPLRARRRRNFPEARPRRTISLRLKIDHYLRRRAFDAADSINNGTDRGDARHPGR